MSKNRRHGSQQQHPTRTRWEKTPPRVGNGSPGVAGKTENDNVMQREIASSHLDFDDMDHGFDLKSINQSIKSSILYNAA